MYRGVSGVYPNTVNLPTRKLRVINLISIIRFLPYEVRAVLVSHPLCLVLCCFSQMWNTVSGRLVASQSVSPLDWQLTSDRHTVNMLFPSLVLVTISDMFYGYSCVMCYGIVDHCIVVTSAYRNYMKCCCRTECNFNTQDVRQCSIPGSLWSFQFQYWGIIENIETENFPD